jgi:GH15 family glucan-1,4-alpha-glucosidase
VLKESYALIDEIRLPSGLYLAAPNVAYRYVWIRDCVYMSLPFVDKPLPYFEQTMHRIFDILEEYEWKLNIDIQHKPQESYEYLHARYSDEGKEITDPWGHAQHDMVGIFLFAVSLGIKHGKNVFRNQKDLDIVQKLVYYLQRVEYHNDPDNGMWEEGRELHASSVGACVAGLDAVKDMVHVPNGLIDRGIESLFGLYPRESEGKRADLAQLSLIYPYRLFTGVLANKIVEQTEKYLLQERGVVRYEGDSYYSTLENEHGRGNASSFYVGTEAEWTFGLSWLSLCHSELGNVEKAKMYLQQAELTTMQPGRFPEAYYAKTSTPNPNDPLGWCSAMYILAKEKL